MKFLYSPASWSHAPDGACARQSSTGISAAIVPSGVTAIRVTSGSHRQDIDRNSDDAITSIRAYIRSKKVAQAELRLVSLEVCEVERARHRATIESLVDSGQQHFRDGKAEGLGGPESDDQLELAQIAMNSVAARQIGARCVN